MDVVASLDIEVVIVTASISLCTVALSIHVEQVGVIPKGKAPARMAV